MAFFDFCATFLFDYICSSTVAYLILLDLSKPFDLKEWLDKKKLNCEAVNKFLYFQADVLPKFLIRYLFLSIFRENDWLETRRWTWKRYQFTVGATLISKTKKTRWWKEYLSSANCSFTEMSENARIRKK